jgi:hypothetical protein
MAAEDDNQTLRRRYVSTTTITTRNVLLIAHTFPPFQTKNSLRPLPWLSVAGGSLFIQPDGTMAAHELGSETPRSFDDPHERKASEAKSGPVDESCARGWLIRTAMLTDYMKE